MWNYKLTLKFRAKIKTKFITYDIIIFIVVVYSNSIIVIYWLFSNIFLFSQKQGKSESLKILKLLFLLEVFKLKSSSIIIITCNYIILKIFLQSNNVNSTILIEWLLYIIYFNGLNETFNWKKKKWNNLHKLYWRIDIYIYRVCRKL